MQERQRTKILFPNIQNNLIIMNSPHTKQNQLASKSFRVFDEIYKRKFSNQSMSELAEKRRIVASQLRRDKPDFISNFQQIALKDLRKSKSVVGSLLPKLKQIETIAKSQKKPKTKTKSSSLSKLEIYLIHKNITKQQQLNILFLTQKNSFVSDKTMNEKFCNLLSITQSEKPKNLRALLNLAGGSQLTEQGKKRKIDVQKQQMTQIVKQIISQIHNQQNKRVLEEQSSQSEQSNSILQKDQAHTNSKQQKGIGWVLKQCKKYNRKFKVNKSKSKSKKKPPAA